MGCSKVTSVRCSACDQVREEDEPERPGPCRCGAKAAKIERCEACPMLMIHHVRAHSPAGWLLERVLEHEFDTKHYRVSTAEVDAELRDGLKILEEERARWESDDRKRRDQEREAGRIEAEMAQRQRARAEGRA